MKRQLLKASAVISNNSPKQKSLKESSNEVEAELI